MPVPALIYAAARRLWVGNPDVPTDASTVREWASRRWPGTRWPNVETMALWVLSIAIQDGHEG